VAVAQVRTTVDLLAEQLRSMGVTRVFATPSTTRFPRLDHVVVPEAQLAVLLADASGRTTRAPGVAMVGERTLHLGSAPGVPPDRVVVDDPASALSAVAGWSLGSVHATTEIDLDLDVSAPVAADVAITEPLVVDDDPGQVFTLAPDLAELRIAVLAGPGVIRLGQVDALRAAARALGLGVVNTWGAKGVFRWDHPLHHGTAGLQADDFALAGVADAQLVVATGLDPLESPPERWAGGHVLEVHPRHLGALALRWPEPGDPPPPPALYTRLAAALAPSYARATGPLAPARAAGDTAEVLPGGGLVVADPGPAGLWVARALPTSEPGSVVVPASNVKGFAAAAGLVASFDGRPAIGVVTEPPDPATLALLELAAAWERPLTLAVWGADTGVSSAGEHRARLVGALASPGVDVVAVPVDFSETRLLVEVAGEVVAWAHPEL
jgi:thiamine pyrophosphate-dependent acetolactate synthase large subunit-like protein